MASSKLERSTIPLVSPIDHDEITAEAIAPFDLMMDDATVFYQYLLPELPRDYNIGVIVGSSGSGKSLLLNKINASAKITHFSKSHSIASHFGSAQDAQERLYAVGLNSVPKWKLPFQSLSNGEQHRVYIAVNLHSSATIDEFTSVVDRNVAKSLSMAVSRYIRQNDIKRVVFATPHRDVIPFLKPDWIIDTDAGEFITNNPEENVGRWWSEYIKGDYAVGTIHYT